MTGQSHADRLEVDQAKNGIDTLRKRINDVDSAQTSMHLDIYTSRSEALKRSSEHLENSLSETIHKLFPEDTPQRAQMLDGARTADWSGGFTDKDSVKNKLDSNLARAKDALELGIRLLEAKIVRLTGQSAAAPSTTPPQLAKSRPEKDLINFRVRIPFVGIEIDVKEAWRRLKG